MGASQRTKGATYEREIINNLKDRLGIDCHRNLRQYQCNEEGDIILDKFVIECKRRASIAVYDWIKQAEKSCNEFQRPIVVCRADRETSLAIMRWEHFIALLGNEVK